MVLLIFLCLCAIVVAGVLTMPWLVVPMPVSPYVVAAAGRAGTAESLLSTHPSLTKRLERLVGHLPPPTR
ncbi:hypothetical protein [Streptomyces profundus]|uniref:hypothetical protein n=1 Tax=Streptomyces profundus TaxID=2867410 RepID=UPI001D16B94E|nr:hypothetical protein [Streptomyces sp. MA3_2.13]UED85134.1 hypothetical protein K4G22_13770 [Streptomyces sp. MA3_2.13]